MLCSVIERATGIPSLHLASGDKEKILTLETNLKQYIIGQNNAIECLVKAIKRSQAGLKYSNRPIGSFLFLGPTGVGKTETAEILTRELFGSKNAVIRFDMSEFMEKHAQSKMIGAPPGYVGYEEGGSLTEAVRTRPYSLILFDEIEKAHPDVLNTLLQILDEGRLTDNQGHHVNFEHTIVICTSNIGTELDPVEMKTLSHKEKQAQLLPLLKKFLKRELINRIDEIIYFDQLGQKELTQILDLMINELNTALLEKNLVLEVTKPAKEKLTELGFDPEFGARPLRRTLQNEIETPLADLLIKNGLKEGKIVCDVKDDNFIFLA